MSKAQVAEVMRRLRPVFRAHWHGGDNGEAESRKRWRVFLADVRRALSGKVQP